MVSKLPPCRVLASQLICYGQLLAHMAVGLCACTQYLKGMCMSIVCYLAVNTL